MQESRIKRV